jgi:hypothetical protein
MNIRFLNHRWGKWLMATGTPWCAWLECTPDVIGSDWFETQDFGIDAPSFIASGSTVMDWKVGRQCPLVVRENLH